MYLFILLKRKRKLGICTAKFENYLSLHCTDYEEKISGMVGQIVESEAPMPKKLPTTEKLREDAVACPDCGARISNEVESCRECGEKLERGEMK